VITLVITRERPYTCPECAHHVEKVNDPDHGFCYRTFKLGLRKEPAIIDTFFRHKCVDYKPYIKDPSCPWEQGGRN
jgi:hypothetical protein